MFELDSLGTAELTVNRFVDKLQEIGLIMCSKADAIKALAENGLSPDETKIVLMPKDDTWENW
jgi:hypothetical protein